MTCTICHSQPAVVRDDRTGRVCGSCADNVFVLFALAGLPVEVESAVAA